MRKLSKDGYRGYDFIEMVKKKPVVITESINNLSDNNALIRGEQLSTIKYSKVDIKRKNLKLTKLLLIFRFIRFYRYP